jgi:phosphoglucosamine mutase
MNRKYFGTDGVRGEYGASFLTDVFAYRLGRAAGRWILDKKVNASVVIGRDTRESGPALLNALACGFRDAGIGNIQDLGILPTPAVAVYTRHVQASLGVMITASHNPAKDNGIKFFDSRGLKFPDEVELELEKLLEATGAPETIPQIEIEPTNESSSVYLNLLYPILEGRSLAGLKIVVDTANGSTFKTTPTLLGQLGANLVTLGDKPDGLNINQGVGSQYPHHLESAVLEHRADLGIAHDGDGDRVLLCDETGSVLDGDTLLCLLGFHALKQGKLAKNTLVATMQSNLGLDRAMKEAGGNLVRTDIGDRYVLEEMLKSGYSLGGENSGHVIFSDINSTGDGLLAALQVLSIILDEGKPLSELRKCMELYPQRTGAISLKEKPPLENNAAIQDTLKSLKHEMGGNGRVLLRYSGTEPKIRLLIEGESPAKVDAWYQTLEYRIIQELS